MKNFERLSIKKLLGTLYLVLGTWYFVPRTLHSKHQPRWVLEQLLHANEEANGLTAIDDPMIVRQGQIHHWSDDYLPIFGNGALHNVVHAQNSGLGCIDNR